LTGSRPQASIEPSKGVHLVFSREDVKIGDAAIVLPETEDKRILFVVPWESRVVFGTTDTGSGDLDHPTATPEDIAYLLKYINLYFKVHLTEENIISVYAGYRPLVKPHSKSGGSTAKISRSHEVLQSPSGLVSIVGGKMTSYRRMAQDTVDVLSRRDGAKPLHPTMSLRLQGSAGWPKAQRELETRGVSLGLTPQVIQHLINSYGSEASTLMDLIAGDASLARLLIEDLPYIYAEVQYASCNEMAMTPYDFLARRTSITLVDRQRGLGIVDEVAALMAKEHGWSFEQQQAMVDAYRTDIQSQIDAEKVQVATM
jgi:glycerol-3-phosphate dehydrogenase